MRLRPWLLLLVLRSAATWADDVAALVRDRAGLERAYYNHRAG